MTAMDGKGIFAGLSANDEVAPKAALAAIATGRADHFPECLVMQHSRVGARSAQASLR
jgi:hypothetical protein